MTPIQFLGTLFLSMLVLGAVWTLLVIKWTREKDERDGRFDSEYRRLNDSLGMYFKKRQGR